MALYTTMSSMYTMRGGNLITSFLLCNPTLGGASTRARDSPRVKAPRLQSRACALQYPPPAQASTPHKPPRKEYHNTNKSDHSKECRKRYRMVYTTTHKISQKSTFCNSQTVQHQCMHAGVIPTISSDPHKSYWSAPCAGKVTPTNCKNFSIEQHEQQSSITL